MSFAPITILYSFDGGDGNANNRYRSSGKSIDPLDYLDWHHIAVVAKSNRTYFYLDGQSVGSSDRQESSDVRYVGNSSAGEAFSEFLDDVRIYSISLTDAEVAQIYGNGFGDLGSTPLISGTSPVHNNPIEVSVNFGNKGVDGNVTDFTSIDIQAYGGSVTDFNGSGFSYDFNVTADAGSSEVVLIIPSEAGTDASNHPTEGASRRILFHPAVYRESDLISYWSFDEANGSIVIDNGPARNLAVLRGTASLNSGKFGKALSLGGAGDYAEIPKFRGIYSDGDFTLSTWVKLAGLGIASDADDAGIFCRSGGGNDSVLLWYDVNGASTGNRTFTFNVGNTGTNVNRLNGPDNAAQVGIWHHVASVMNGNERFLYLDGKRVGHMPIGTSSTIRMEGSSVRIGSWDGTGNFDFEGLIDDVRLYDVAFPDADIAVLYGNGFGDMGVIPLITVANNTDQAPVPVSIDFQRFGNAETVTNFDISDLLVKGGVVSDFNGSDSHYTFNVTPYGQPSIISISLPSDAADAGSGEKSSAVTTSFSFRPSLTAEETSHWYGIPSRT